LKSIEVLGKISRGGCSRDDDVSMPKKPLPQFIEPMQASSVKEPFNSPDWIFETKLDGFRAIAVIDSAGKVLLTGAPN
jgi:bifunctional non-homologous end joining protein LigD